MTLSLLEQFISIGKGMWVTVPLFFSAFSIGGALGLCAAILRRQNAAARMVIDASISVLRGTPILLQLSFVYFMLPSLGIQLGFLGAGIVTLSINSAAYIGEIFRSGIDSFPRGQFEAAKVLGISTYGLWKDIVIPQVLRGVWSALINESIALVKETALISTIGGMDILRCARQVGATHFTYFTPLIIAGAYYYSIVLCIAWLGKYIEKRNFLW